MATLLDATEIASKDLIACRGLEVLGPTGGAGLVGGYWGRYL